MEAIAEIASFMTSENPPPATIHLLFLKQHDQNTHHGQQGR